MTIAINEFRLSYVWTSTLLPVSAMEKTGPFAGRASYEALVESLRQTGPQEGHELPWEHKYPFAQHFWVGYLGLANPGSIAGGHAWSHALPIRATAPPFSVKPPASAAYLPAKLVTACRISVENFSYPFGLGLIATVTVKGALPPQTWIDLAYGLDSEKLEAVFPDGAVGTNPLRAVAADCLTNLGRRGFGSSPEIDRPSEPFKIMTVISASGVAPNASPKKDLQLYINAAATLKPNWRTAKLGGLVIGQNLIDIRSEASVGDLVYAVKRGRTIWSPSAFLPAPKARNSLGCYHRNQVLAAMQTEALCGLASAMDRRIANNPDQPPHLDALAKIAVDRLPALHAGRETYRSRSLQKIIDDSGVSDALGRLSRRYGRPPWPLPTKP